MNALKKLMGMVALLVGLSWGQAAHAGIPVIDATNLAQQIQQVASWAVQAQQMVDQLTKMQQQYDSWTGNRNMGSLASGVSRNYLPSTYQDILTNGVGNWNTILTTLQKYDINTGHLNSGSDAVKNYNAVLQQAGMNRAAAEMSFDEASQRFATMQTLIDKINVSNDPKDIADLQARIQAEQVMMQNESNKLAALAQLSQSQQQLQAAQQQQIRMKSVNGTMPTGY